MLDTHDTIETVVQMGDSTEMRDLARVIIRASGVVLSYWSVIKMPHTHPYYQTVRMVQSYLQKRYHV